MQKVGHPLYVVSLNPEGLRAHQEREALVELKQKIAAFNLEHGVATRGDVLFCPSPKIGESLWFTHDRHTVALIFFAFAGIWGVELQQNVCS